MFLTEKNSNEIPVYCVRGAADIAGIGEMWAQLSELREQTAQIDLSGVVYADSAFLQMLCILDRDAPQLKLTNPSDSILALASIFNLERLFARA
ncbi:STAS domain-containing protein [Chitinibacter sp. SCUT-21]|uniref:STAS domain-containing protein n=1 Tax=Chitinibacter sp. SCUT-21 TaxID=2970891 RepID=UPI0035A62870